MKHSVAASAPDVFRARQVRIRQIPAPYDCIVPNRSKEERAYNERRIWK